MRHIKPELLLFSFFLFFSFCILTYSESAKNACIPSLKNLCRQLKPQVRYWSIHHTHNFFTFGSQCITLLKVFSSFHYLSFWMCQLCRNIEIGKTSIELYHTLKEVKHSPHPNSFFPYFFWGGDSEVGGGGMCSIQLVIEIFYNLYLHTFRIKYQKNLFISTPPPPPSQSYSFVTHPFRGGDHVAGGGGRVRNHVGSSPADGSHIPETAIQVEREGRLYLRHPVWVPQHTREKKTWRLRTQPTQKNAPSQSLQEQRKLRYVAPNKAEGYLFGLW